ncbi:hypothetical protein [Streptomyces sp. GC420]|uniref:hypothetical protein n=1 Tax=Streptomyces sp. GC420 TaxID=2697568 RepID=UPI001415231D|nr:hypothetical protein [Streptomyces sp. GC420]NBM17604.1 hypothetical protein [Streptomyces sp. GC420]
MGMFLEAAAGFPTVLFTAALLVAVCFWLLVAVGVAGADSFDGDADLDVLGLGGMPVAVAFSLLTAVGWFSSLSATVLLDPVVPGGALRGLTDLAVLAASLVAAWRVTRVLVRPLHRLFPDEPGPSRADFVGLTCTIRTGRVDAEFGQAEVAALDGSTAVVQVRRQGDEPLGLGGTGLLYAYDEAGEFFWVAPYDPALDPRQAA